MLNEPSRFDTRHQLPSSTLNRERDLQTLLSTLLGLPLPLRINLRRERILKPQRNRVNNKDQARQQNTRRLAKPKRRAQKAHRTAMVHGRRGHTERKTRNHLIHQDTKVVAQVRARDTQRPHAGQHQRVTTEQQADGQTLRERGEQCWMRGLGAQGALVDGVAGDSEQEDCHGEGVAAAVGVVAGQAREGLVAVFAAGGGVPEGGVEDDEGCGGCARDVLVFGVFVGGSDNKASCICIKDIV